MQQHLLFTPKHSICNIDIYLLHEALLLLLPNLNDVKSCTYTHRHTQPWVYYVYYNGDTLRSTVSTSLRMETCEHVKHGICRLQ